jgi:hypothetical protein
MVLPAPPTVQAQMTRRQVWKTIPTGAPHDARARRCSARPRRDPRARAARAKAKPAAADVGRVEAAVSGGAAAVVMRVLVACEYSGRVRDAFRALGHDAMSCDLLPSEAPGPHHQGDVRPLLREPWDLVIAHPPCTRLCNSGVRWLAERELWGDMLEAVDFFRACLGANAPRVAVENPVMHRYARDLISRHGPDFTVQPWQFGDPAKKRTCFWTRGLPPLRPTSIMTADDARAECHLEPPGPDRWKNRSRTYPGIARAMAEQWGAP